jgi:hypothetical protein
MALTNSYTRPDVQNNRRMSEYNDYVSELNKCEHRLFYLFFVEDCSEIEHMQMYDTWKPKPEDVQEEMEFLINKKLPDLEQHLELFEKTFPNLVPATKKRWFKRIQEIKEKGAVDVNRQTN